VVRAPLPFTLVVSGGGTSARAGVLRPTASRPSCLA